MDTLRKFLDVLQITIIIILLGVIFYMKSCNGKNKPCPPPDTTVIEIKYDTITKTIVKYKPKLDTLYIRKTDTLHIPTFVSDDSLKNYLIEQYNNLSDKYNSVKIYSDSQKLDSLNLTITDTVYQNSIVNRSIKYDLKYKTETIHKTVYVKDKGFYGGVGLMGNTNRIDYIGTEFLYKTPDRLIYGLGLGVNSNFDPTLSGKIYWKLSK